MYEEKFYINIKVSDKFKNINIKKTHILLFNDIIDIRNFDPNNIKLRKSYTKIFLFTTLDM